MELDFTSLVASVITVVVNVAVIAHYVGKTSGEIKTLGVRLENVCRTLSKFEKDAQDSFKVRTETLKDVERIKTQLEFLTTNKKEEIL